MVKCSLELDLNGYIGVTVADKDSVTVTDKDTQTV